MRYQGENAQAYRRHRQGLSVKVLGFDPERVLAFGQVGVFLDRFVAPVRPLAVTAVEAEAKAMLALTGEGQQGHFTAEPVAGVVQWRQFGGQVAIAGKLHLSAGFEAANEELSGGAGRLGRRPGIAEEPFVSAQPGDPLRLTEDGAQKRCRRQAEHLGVRLEVVVRSRTQNTPLTEIPGVPDPSLGILSETKNRCLPERREGICRTQGMPAWVEDIDTTLGRQAGLTIDPGHEGLALGGQPNPFVNADDL